MVRFSDPHCNWFVAIFDHFDPIINHPFTNLTLFNNFNTAWAQIPVFIVYLVCKVELNLMLRILRLLVKVRWVEL